MGSPDQTQPLVFFGRLMGHVRSESIGTRGYEEGPLLSLPQPSALWLQVKQMYKGVERDDSGPKLVPTAANRSLTLSLRTLPGKPECPQGQSKGATALFAYQCLSFLPLLISGRVSRKVFYEKKGAAFSFA